MNLAIFITIQLAFLFILEVLLLLGIINEDDSNTPTYIPRELKLKDRLIDNTGNTDIHGFRSLDGHNKINYLASKQNDGCNIVVLGDSFIWGDGVEPEQRWTDILDKNLKNCTIHSFGKGGWNSLEQFQFYESMLKSLDFEQLLIGYVTNDPHLALRETNSYYYLPADEKKLYSNWDDKSLLVRGHASAFGIEFSLPIECQSIKCNMLTFISNLTYPLRLIRRTAESLNIKSTDYVEQKSSLFFSSILNNLYPLDGDMQSATQILAFGYDNWKKYLYLDRNFNRWKQAVQSFSSNSRHPITFVLTTYSTDHRNDPASAEIKKVISALNEIGLDNVNCNVPYQGARPRSEWANPADPHPGANEAKYFASCAAKHLEKNASL